MYAFGSLMVSECAIEVDGYNRYMRGEMYEGHVPSAKPKDSTTGSIARMVKKDVPSFISSLTILPLRRATTP